MRNFRIAASGLFVTILGLAVVSKTFDGSLFKEFVTSALGVEEGVAEIALVFAVLVETSVAASLVLAWHETWPWLLTGLLFLLFSGIAAAAMVFGFEKECGCFGSILSTNYDSAWPLVRNTCLAALAYYGWSSINTEKREEQTQGSQQHAMRVKP